MYLMKFVMIASLLRKNFTCGFNYKSMRRNIMNSSMKMSYLAVHVKGSITASSFNTFYSNTLNNAKNSILEKGISRFDVLRNLDVPDDFLLVEVYNTNSGPDEHKNTNHYKSWRDGVASIMAKPRSASKYHTIFPPKSHWKTDAQAGDIIVEKYIKNHPWISPSEKSNAFATGGMFAVVVDIEVTPGSEASFIETTLKNCKASVKEPGVHRFDLLQNIENVHNFVLVEVYNNPNAPAAHKASKHYADWAATVANQMARPRSSSKYVTQFPEPLYWHNSAEETHFGEEAKESWIGTAGRGLNEVAGNSFSFMGPKIKFGRNIAGNAIRAAVKEYGIKEPLIVAGSRGERLAAESGLLHGLFSPEQCTRFRFSGEPTVEDVLLAVDIAKKSNCDSVIAVGGGSSIDIGKAVAALLTNPGDIYDYLEVVGKGMPIKNLPVTFIAIPTTSGTGSEVTKNAVLKCTQNNRKVSIRHDTMLPSLAIVDPVLTNSCSPALTASVGLDALCQVIEPYVSRDANPFTDALAREGILRGSRSLRAVVADGSNVEAREDMAVTSVIGGLVLANAKLGAVHGYASVLGGMFDKAPHGAVCAALLPFVFRKNAQKLAKDAASGDLTATARLQRFTDVARIVTANDHATAEDGSIWLAALVRDLGIPPLSQLCGMQPSQVQEVAEATAIASSTKGNPIPLTVNELKEILEEAL